MIHFQNWFRIIRYILFFEKQQNVVQCAVEIQLTNDELGAMVNYISNEPIKENGGK